MRIVAALRRLLPHTKKEEAIFVALYFLVICVYSLIFYPGLMLGHILFFLIPGLYLTLRYWRRNYHAFLFSVLAGVATGFPLQVVAELNNVWDYDFPLFDWLTFGGLRMIPLAWYVLWVGLSISTYSVFFDHHNHRVRSDHRFWRVHYRFIVLCTAVIAGSAFFLISHPQVFIFPHPYIVAGSLLFVVPTVAILFLHPQLIRDTLKAAAFLSLFMLVYELIGLKIGWWEYNGT